MRYEPGFVEDVRARTSLVDLVARDVKLVRSGPGEFIGLCPFHSERTPSFTVSESKGFYHCFGCGAHGSVFDWVMARHGVGFTEVVEDLAIRAGLLANAEGERLPEAKPVARMSEAARSEDKAEKVARARAIWRECRPFAGSLAETYLLSRGLARDLMGADWPPTLRFHPGLPAWNVKQTPPVFEGKWPAMVAYVQGPEGRFFGIHRTFLAEDGRGKAPVSRPKMMLGHSRGGYLRLCRAQREMLIAEGIETTCSVVAATRRAAWAALSEGNLGAPLPAVVRHVTICADNDTKDKANTARRLAEATAAHAARGCAVRIARPPEGMDFNDLLRAGRAAG